MRQPATRLEILRFGPFEADAATGELRKHGVRIKLQKQPFQILIALLEKPNQPVTREELRQRIWGDDTNVDFEHGLNAAVNKLRLALSDSAESPRYIETIPAVGYRLLAPVERQDEAPPQQPVMRNSPTPNRLVAVAGLAAAFFAGWALRPAPSPPSPVSPLQFTVALPDGFWSELAGTRQDFAVSPDGTRLAFVASDNRRSQLWLREFAVLATRAIAPDHQVRGLVWAPDSQSLYFDERNAVRQLTLNGEVIQTIAELPLRSPWMGLLRSDTQLTLYTRAGTFAVPVSGGTPRRLDDAPHRWTTALYGKYLLNVRYETGTGRYRAWAFNPNQSEDERPLLEADSRVLFIPYAPNAADGHLLFIRSGTLLAQRFDASTLRLTADPQAIAEKVFSFHPTGAAAFSASHSGLLVYRAAAAPTRLRWVDSTGREMATLGTPAVFMTPFRLSPDGRRLAATVYEVGKGGMSLWIYDTQDGTARRLTTGRETEAMGVWSPDGTRLAFGRAAGATPRLYARSTQTGGAADPLTPALFQLPTDWSRDGRFILYQTTGGAGEPGADVAVVDLTRTGAAVPILHSEAQEFDATFSPDGTLVAFVSDETGTPELYVQPFAPDPQPHLTDQKRQVSRGGASVIRWRADGQELYFIGSENWIAAAAIDGRGKPKGPTRRLFQVNFPPRQLTSAGPAVGFDVTPDGKRFLVPDTTGVRASPFVVIQNWPALIEKYPVR
jgi:Tol biopolymer transport system component/DNA-binding winged helix-turn-helix (wHTH) protein